MTAIGGCVGPCPTETLAAHCFDILQGLLSYTDEPPRLTKTAGAAFGVGLFGLLPEDSEARPPLLCNDRYMLVADLRLDNRESVAAAVGMDEPLAETTDSEILFAAWNREGDGCVERLVGDFAIAVFDLHRRVLTLARDSTGQRPLFYAHDEHLVGFASMASGLLNDQQFNRKWNMRRTASLLHLVGQGERETYFEGISRVLPGEVVTFSSGRRSSRLHWNPLAAEPQRMSFPEAVEEYRAVLDSAVRSRLRRRSGRAAVHLSSGYDSSAIAAAAAIESRPERVLAYTAAPPSGFAPQVPKGYSGDESPIAALTAARFDLAHQIVQSSDFTLDYLRRQARLYQEPLRNIINGLWADEIRSAAARAGATVLLNGMGGNLTLNAGGSYYLSDWLRQKGLAQWFPQAKAAVQQGHVRWRGALFSSVAPLLPPVLWWSIWRRIRPHHATPATFLRREWALSADDLRRRSYGQPGRSTAEDRVEFARMVDPGVHHKGGLADSGVWELEPLTDRRVIEFSLALTPEQLICNGEGRPVARAALKDLLPAEVLDAPRGVQSADWQLHFRQDRSFEILEEIASCESARNLLDIDAMKAAIENWPDPSSADWRSTTYTSQLPIALTAGVFLKETEAGWHPPA